MKKIRNEAGETIAFIDRGPGPIRAELLSPASSREISTSSLGKSSSASGKSPPELPVSVTSSKKEKRKKKKSRDAEKSRDLKIKQEAATAAQQEGE